MHLIFPATLGPCLSIFSFHQHDYFVLLYILLALLKFAFVPSLISSAVMALVEIYLRFLARFIDVINHKHRFVIVFVGSVGL